MFDSLVVLTPSKSTDGVLRRSAFCASTESVGLRLLRNMPTSRLTEMTPWTPEALAFVVAPVHFATFAVPQSSFSAGTVRTAQRCEQRSPYFQHLDNTVF